MKNIKRSDGEEKIVTKSVAVLKIAEPKNLTLTGTPANQIGFKVVRKDDPMSDTNDARVRRVRRSLSPTLVVLFPDGMSEEDVKGHMEEYGFTDYTLSAENKDGISYKAIRSDLKNEPSPDEAISIGIGNGIKVLIHRSAMPAPQGKSGIVLAAVEFPAEKFSDASECTAWLTRNSVDFLENGVENSGASVVYRRVEESKDVEVRKLTLDDGVVLHVVRADENDIPTELVTIVSESAYGNWGWGFLDFAMALADVEFSRAAEEGIARLHSVLEHILFYSYLPLSVRKQLVTDATSQFASYINGLMDALPQKTVTVNRSIKESSMSTKKDAVQRSEANPADQTEDKNKPAPKAEESKTAAEPQFVTRDDVAEIVRSAVAPLQDAIKALTPAPAKDAAADGKTSDPQADGMENVLRSVKEVGEKIGTQMTQIGDRLTKLESQTVVRSDNPDPKQATIVRDVFAGCLPGLTGKRS